MHPENEQQILFACPSNNDVVAVWSTDGGASFSDVSGILPNAEIGGMLGTPDGRFVLRPQFRSYVFDVETLTWHDLAGGTLPGLLGGQCLGLSRNRLCFLPGDKGFGILKCESGADYLELSSLTKESFLLETRQSRGA